MSKSHVFDCYGLWKSSIECRKDIDGEDSIGAYLPFIIAATEPYHLPKFATYIIQDFVVSRSEDPKNFSHNQLRSSFPRRLDLRLSILHSPGKCLFLFSISTLFLWWVGTLDICRAKGGLLECGDGQGFLPEMLRVLVKEIASDTADEAKRTITLA